MITELEPCHYNAVIKLGNLVHGEGYLDLQSLELILKKGFKNNINSCFVAIDSGKLLGFRLSYAAQQWQIDKWCSPDKWQVAAEKVGYFKCNTVAEEARGQGLGGQLLQSSIDALQQQGAVAGVSHLWKQSPNNSAVRYFSKAGGQLIKQHPNRWNNSTDHPDYICVLCGKHCRCTASEMLLTF